MLVRKSNGRRGFSLIEVTMYLVTVGLMVAGVMLLYGNSTQNRQTADQMKEINVVAQVVKGLYGSQPDYSLLTTATVAQSAQMPPHWVSASTGLVTAFASPMTISGNTSAWGFLLKDIPLNTCIKMLTFDYGPNTAWMLANGATATYGSSYTPSSAQNSCVTAGNIVQLWFY